MALTVVLLRVAQCASTISFVVSLSLKHNSLEREQRHGHSVRPPSGWPWAAGTGQQCEVERRADGSCPLAGCRISPRSPGVVQCDNHPDLGLGECPIEDAGKIANKLHEQPSRADVVDIIRNLGTNPVYHDERWLTLDGHPDSRPASPVESQWEVLHPRGLYAMEGLFTESEADELVQRLQARGRSDNISAYDVTQTVLRLISQTWMYMCQVHQGLPKHESGIFRANFLKCEFRKSTTWDISRNYEIFPESWLQRMANLTGSDLANFEMTQASKYVPGDFYSEHFDDAPCDYLSDGSRVKSMDFQQLRVSMFNNVSCDAVQRRSGTILVYLTGESEHEGGATHFPRLGVRVHARKGRAIFFRHTHPDGSVDPMLLHAAEGVSHGVKYVVQQWIRHPSRGPNS